MRGVITCSLAAITVAAVVIGLGAGPIDAQQKNVLVAKKVAAAPPLDGTLDGAWKSAAGSDDIEFLADGSADFAKATGLELDASAGGLGIRSKRYCMVVDDGVVKSLAIEDAPGKADASGAEALLKAL